MSNAGYKKHPRAKDSSSTRRQPSGSGGRDFFSNLVPGKSPLCSLYKKQKCQKGNCKYLHLCLHYVFSNCKFGSKCKFSHNLRDPHNDKLLRVSSDDHAKLIFDQLNQVMLTRKKQTDDNDVDDNDSPVEETTQKLRRLDCDDDMTDPVEEARESLRPLVCRFYNTKNGCQRKSTRGKPCARLHVCKYYIEGTCKFTECKRSHSLERNTDNRNILSTNDISMKSIREYFPSDGKGSTESDDSSKSDVCQYYKRGKCDFNDKCKNLHADVDAPGKKSASTADKNYTGSDGMENLDICWYNMNGICSYKDRCKNMHSDKPYKWFFEKRGKWSAFPENSNDELEQAFCDPNKLEAVAASSAASSANGKSIKVVLVHFNSMTWNFGDHSHGKVKRLSTASWGNFQDNVYSTRWLWFWQNDDKTFTEYGKSFEKDPSVKKSDVTSEAIEKQYIQNSPDITFKTTGFQHVISFNKDSIGAEAPHYQFKQVNILLKTERIVRRRPRLFDWKQCEKEKREHAKTRLTNSGRTFPSTWTSIQDNAEDDVQLIEVEKTGAEFKEIEDFVKKTMLKTVTVTSVKRIQSKELWEGYFRKKTYLSKKYPEKYPDGNVNEKRLFHGTKKSIIKAICQQGFDWRLNGSSVGTLYGKGSYFARDSNYSAKLTDSNELFIVKVLVGTSALGNPYMVRPPPRDPADPLVNLHDSCVNNLMDPSIFVVFETSQAYPEYLVSYS